MAFVVTPQTDEEKRKQEEALKAASAAAGPVSGGSGTLPAGAQPTSKSGASGNFTNLQRYLSENKSQATDLAGKVAEGVTTAGEEAKAALEGLSKAGKEQIEASRVAPSGVVEEAAMSPTSVAGDEAKKAAFSKELGATYTGPSSLSELEGYETVQDKIRKAQEKAGLTGTEAGRTTLLSEMGGPSYGKGKAALNQLLVSGNPEAAGIIKSASEPYLGLQDYLSAKNEEAKTAAAKAAEEAASTKAAAQARFTGEGGVVQQTTSDLLAKLEAAKTGGAAEAKTATKALAAWNPTDADLAEVGITRKQYNSLKAFRDVSGGGVNVDPTKFLTTLAPDAQYTISNVASAEDYAQEKALEDLLGISIPNLNPEQANLAGTAPESLLNFDMAGATQRFKNNLRSWMGTDIPKLDSLIEKRVIWGDVMSGARNLNDIVGMDFYNALRALSALNGAASLAGNGNDFIQKETQAAKDFMSIPLVQTLYKAARTARENQTPGTSPDALMNHLPPDVRAMLT